MKRKQIILSDALDAKLTVMAAEDNTTQADVIRKSLAFYDWAIEEHKKGNVLCLKKPNGEIKELLFAGFGPV